MSVAGKEIIMSSDTYTPTTSYQVPDDAEVLDGYARDCTHDCYYEGDVLLTPDGKLARFDAETWLARHDAEVRIASLKEALAALPLPDEDARSGMLTARGLIAGLIVFSSGGEG